MNFVMRINAFWRFDNVLENFSQTFFGRLCLAAMVFGVFYVIGKVLPKVISKAVYKMPNYRDLESSAGVFKAVLKIINWIMGASIILDILGLQGVFTKLIASAGIVGMIAGFALKDVTSNSFSGLLIKAEKPFVVGDWVNINNNIGVVREIGTVMVGIETLGGHMAYIPNQNIYNTSFINYSKFGHYRIVVEMGISYGDDLEKVEQVALQTLRKLPFIKN